VGDVPVAGSPAAATHGAVFERDLDAFVGGAFGEFTPDLLELRQAFFDRTTADAAGKTGNAGGAEVVRIVDQRFPAAQGFDVFLTIFQRVTEHAQGRDSDVAVTDDVLEALGELGQVLVHGLPEIWFDAFKTMRQDLF
jgi:hypothetical protein